MASALSSRSEPYDPYLPRGGSSANPSGEPGRPQGNNKTAAIQQQIDDTVGIMRENITRVAERGERLDVLQDKTGEFLSNSGILGWLSSMMRWVIWLVSLVGLGLASGME